MQCIGDNVPGLTAPPHMPPAQMPMPMPMVTPPQHDPNAMPLWAKKLINRALLFGVLISCIVVLLGFVHLVHGGEGGWHVCSKESWGISDTFVDLDDYIGKPLISKIDKAMVLRDMFRCELLTPPDSLKRRSESTTDTEAGTAHVDNSGYFPIDADERARRAQQQRDIEAADRRAAEVAKDNEAFAKDPATSAVSARASGLYNTELVYDAPGCGEKMLRQIAAAAADDFKKLGFKKLSCIDGSAELEIR
jgi:hypothetical protein